MITKIEVPETSFDNIIYYDIYHDDKSFTRYEREMVCEKARWSVRYRVEDKMHYFKSVEEKEVWWLETMHILFSRFGQ